MKPNQISNLSWRPNLVNLNSNEKLKKTDCVDYLRLKKRLIETS